MADAAERDPVSGTETTGHEWDGIREFNNPLPRWWVLVFYATIIWSFAYWVLYPSWPLITDYTHGVLGYSQREGALRAVDEARAARREQSAALEQASPEEVRANRSLFEFALANGKAAFGDNCAGCHGAGATGAKGYPNLQDDEWLWGGTLDQIYTTIRFGIRSTHDETRQGEMMAFGRDQILTRQQVRQVADYVLSLSGRRIDRTLDLEAGRTLFAENCAACHGENAKGNAEMGAPDLTDPIWLYGNSPADVIATVTHGRKGVMPAWEGRLDPATLKSLAIYVHSLGGGR